MTPMKSAALAVMVTVGTAGAAAAQQDFHWSGPLAEGQTIEIRNIKGQIRAEPASGGEVTVTARPGAGRADRVHVEMVRRDYGVVICTIYPSRGEGRGGNSRGDGDDRGPRDACSPRDQMNVRDDADMEFVVRVPAGVKLAVQSVSGDVDARGLLGPVDAHSVSGNVHVSTLGEARASTVSGNVFAAMGRITSRGLEFSSVSGDVTLELPAGTDADFNARAVSGEIDSDFPLGIEGRRGCGRDDNDDNDDGGRVHVCVGHQMQGHLGRGGPELNVTTVSGDIHLRRTR